MNEKQKEYLMSNGINVSEGMTYFMDNDQIYEKYLGRFLQEPTFPALFKAIDNQQKEEARIAAHSLKSITGTLGLSELNKMVKEQDAAFKLGNWEEGISNTKSLKEAYNKVIKAIETYQSLN